MYSGSFPWRGMSHDRIIDNVVAGGRLLFHHDALPRYVQLASACMSYRPGDRPASFSAICGVLCGMDPGDPDCCAVVATAPGNASVTSQQPVPPVTGVVSL